MLFMLTNLFCYLEYADLTWQEFQRHKLGAAQNCSATLKGSHKVTEATLPDTVTIILSCSFIFSPSKHRKFRCLV